MEERYSQGMKILFYVLSVVFPVIGIIIGIVLMTREDEESKALGKNVLLGSLIHTRFRRQKHGRLGHNVLPQLWGETTNPAWNPFFGMSTLWAGIPSSARCQ